MHSFPALHHFVQVFPSNLSIEIPHLEESPETQKSLKITRIALNNSHEDLLKARRHARHALRQEEAFLMAGRTDTSPATIISLRRQICLLSHASKEQDIFYREIAWKEIQREILLLQKKRILTPPQKKLLVQVAQTFKKLFSHYKTQKIFLTDFTRFYKKSVLPLEDRIIRIEWRKKFRSIAILAAKQASVWSLRIQHRAYIQDYVEKESSIKHHLAEERGIFLKRISLDALSEDELTVSALFDFVSHRGMIPHVSYPQEEGITLLKPCINNMQLFHSLYRNGKIDSVLSYLSAESEWMAVFSLFCQMQDLHDSNVGFVPSIKQRNTWEVVLFDGGLSLGESSRIQSVMIGKQLYHIHPLRCCFLENDSFANRCLRISTLDRILHTDMTPLASWMERSDAPIHLPFLKDKKNHLQTILPRDLSVLSLSDMRKQTEYNGSLFTLSLALREQNALKSDTETRLLRQLLPRVSPLQKKSFFARIDRARDYIRLWRSFHRSTVLGNQSLDTAALLFYIRHPHLPFHTIQRCQLEHRILQKQHTNPEKYSSIIKELKQAIEPTFFHLACVLYPDLADLTWVLKNVHKIQRIAIKNLGDCYHPLETQLQEVQRAFPRSEEAQIAAWIGYRMRRNPKKIFWAYWGSTK